MLHYVARTSDGPRRIQGSAIVRAIGEGDAAGAAERAAAVVRRIRA